MNHTQLKKYTSKKWKEIKELEQEYNRILGNINQLHEQQHDTSFKCQKKLDDIEKAHQKYNKAI